MGPAVVLWGSAALGLLVFAATMHRTGRASERHSLPLRWGLPGIGGGVLVVGGALAAIPTVPPIVIAGLMAYTGIAAAAMWRMASLDRASPWMARSRRLARIGIAVVALTWLGLVLGLLLQIADLVANARSGL